MHWVDRGAEPASLECIRNRYTPGWVAHYRQGTGRRPTDSRWQAFRNDLSQTFFGLCGYCERTAKGEVDHFRPKRRFPNLVYEWSNWVFACPDCNRSKRDKWPSGGYVDPCANTRAARPEAFFTFDTTSGELLPRAGLTARRQRKAQQTIDDLGLNDFHQLKARMDWLTAIRGGLSDGANENYLAYIASRSTNLSSLARVLMEERGFIVDD